MAAAELPPLPTSAPDYAALNRATARSRERRNMALGLAFLGPNILGFLTFTAIPLIFSMVLAFSNWDLKLHNDLRAKELAQFALPAEHIRFIGLSNFMRLFQLDDFWRFMGNTLFFMMAMPFSIAASLGAAMLLSKDLRGGSRRVWLGLICGAVLVGSTLLLASVGAGATGMTLLIGGLVAAVLISGTIGGTTLYRTLFYVPNFTAGVATFLLWKKLYNPSNGPIAVALTPPLQQLTRLVNGTPAWTWQMALVLCLGLASWMMMRTARRLRILWEEGEVGWGAALLSAGLLLVPVICILGWYGVVDYGALLTREGRAFFPAGAAGLPLSAPAVTGFLGKLAVYIRWSGVSVALPAVTGFMDKLAVYIRWYGLPVAALAMTGVLVVTLIWTARKVAKADRRFVTASMSGLGSGLMLGSVIMIAQLILIGLAAVLWNLPEWSALDPAHKLYGLATPKWLDDMNWAKPAIMMMGFWGAIGSNTMLLYLAALTNVPQDLYEAADIDGASGFQKFWHVTWPQLAPTTFFIVVMGVIGGLQGGFEMARVMTNGGPAGSTTTLAYYIYTEGFETGRLGFSSAVAWTLFLMVLVVTLFNWKFGNKYVND